MRRIVGKKCERQTLFMTYNNCLLTLDSFGFFLDILVYRFPVTIGQTHSNSLLWFFSMNVCPNVCSVLSKFKDNRDLEFAFL